MKINMEKRDFCIILIQSVLYAKAHSAEVAEKTFSYISPSLRELPGWCLLAFWGIAHDALKAGVDCTEAWRSFQDAQMAELNRRKEL